MGIKRADHLMAAFTSKEINNDHLFSFVRQIQIKKAFHNLKSLFSI